MKQFHMILSVLLIMCALTACAAKEPSGSGKYATIGDAVKAGDGEGAQTNMAFDEEHFIYVIETPDEAVRLVADVPKDVRAAMDEVDIADEDFEAKIFEIVSPLPVTEEEDLKAGIPTQEELDAYVGKTGQELLDEGFEASGYVEDEQNIDFFMVKGLYEYRFTAAEHKTVDGEETEELVKGLTVEKAAYEALSYYVTDLQYHP